MTLALIVPALGCARDDDEAATVTVDRETWIKQASAICEDMKDELDELDFNTTSHDEFRAAMSDFRVIARRHLARIAQLRPPPGDAARIDEMLTLYERAVAASADVADAFPAKGGKPTRSEAAAFEEAEKKVDRYGHVADAIAEELGVTCLTE
jgi:hypothetical protein